MPPRGERQSLTHLFVTCSEARLFGSLLLIRELKNHDDGFVDDDRK